MRLPPPTPARAWLIPDRRSARSPAAPLPAAGGRGRTHYEGRWRMPIDRPARTLRMLSVATAGELVYQVASANLSSPQSNELDAGARAPTLQKWVNISNAETLAWVAFLCVLDGSMWPALGGGLALGGLVIKYKYAINSGMRNQGYHARGTWAGA